MNQRIHVGFFGTPEFSAAILRDILRDDRLIIDFVVTGVDKSVGRHHELQFSPVKTLAREHDIPVLQPTRIRDNEDFLKQIRAYHVDYLIVAAYGKILPQELLDIPKKMCLNVHGSILPRYRGASPIQSALLSGERETGITIMEMSAGMDEGDTILMQKILIDPDETTETLFAKFAQISGQVLIDAIEGIEDQTLTPTPQNTENATYCTKITKEDGIIDWNTDARTIYRAWQAYAPWPGISTYFQGKRLILERIAYSDRMKGNIGSVFQDDDQSIHVNCRIGSLTLIEVKLEGRKSQKIRDFLNGNRAFLRAELLEHPNH